MKVYKNEDGKIVIDMEQAEVFLATETTNGVITHEGLSEVEMPLIVNGVFYGFSGSTFGSIHIVEGEKLKWVGIDRIGNNVLWSEERKTIVIGHFALTSESCTFDYTNINKK